MEVVVLPVLVGDREGAQGPLPYSALVLGQALLALGAVTETPQGTQAAGDVSTGALCPGCHFHG